MSFREQSSLYDNFSGAFRLLSAQTSSQIFSRSVTCRQMISCSVVPPFCYSIVVFTSMFNNNFRTVNGLSMRSYKLLWALAITRCCNSFVSPLRRWAGVDEGSKEVGTLVGRVHLDIGGRRAAYKTEKEKLSISGSLCGMFGAGYHCSTECTHEISLDIEIWWRALWFIVLQLKLLTE